MPKKQKALQALMLGSLGVVFGDIGTSPLYAMKILFGLTHQEIRNERLVVYGLVSLLLWTVTFVVSIKYVLFVMRVSNKGEGGIMALVALLRSSSLKRKHAFILLGLVGVALFYGDSAVTPAISVLSAVEGLQVIAPGLTHLVLPITLAIITLLFAIQKYGTGLIGSLFGPVMLVWFITIGLGGAWHIALQPDIIYSLSPLAALWFVGSHPLAAFVAMGAIVLAVTGAEALYADMGHFGRGPIARTWLFIVFPALALCYMGQGALLLHTPEAASNPFFLLFPEFLRIPVVVLATLATLIASQSVISGAFSLTRQAMQLGFLPRMMVRQTSARQIGQIYLPFVNAALFLAVILLVVFFGSSSRLAGAYGVAVSGTLAVDSILFIMIFHNFWRRGLLMTSVLACLLLSFDLVLVAANLSKIRHGGWVPLTLALMVLLLIRTWLAGQHAAAKERRSMEGPLENFIAELQTKHAKSIVRLPGQAVYIGHHVGMAPSALRTAIEELHEIHEKVVIVYVETSTAAHVPDDERVAFDDLGYIDGICQAVITYGFHDSPNIPKTLNSVRDKSPELDFDPYEAEYFISQTRVIPSRRHTMPRWQKSLYTAMSRNALSASDYYHLPIEKTVEVRSLVKI